MQHNMLCLCNKHKPADTMNYRWSKNCDRFESVLFAVPSDRSNMKELKR